MRGSPGQTRGDSNSITSRSERRAEISGRSKGYSLGPPRALYLRHARSGQPCRGLDLTVPPEIAVLTPTFMKPSSPANPKQNSVASRQSESVQRDISGAPGVGERAQPSRTKAQLAARVPRPLCRGVPAPNAEAAQGGSLLVGRRTLASPAAGEPAPAPTQPRGREPSGRRASRVHTGRASANPRPARPVVAVASASHTGTHFPPGTTVVPGRSLSRRPA
jgi:hypothetical protein